MKTRPGLEKEARLIISRVFSYVWRTKEEKTKREQSSVQKFKNISKVMVLFTSVAGLEFPRVRRLRNVHSSGSSDESLAKGYALVFYLRDIS
jgi:hypothetical protein